MLTRRLSLCLLELIDVPLVTDVSAVGTTMVAHVGADERADTPWRLWRAVPTVWNQDSSKEWLYPETNHAG